MLENSQIGYVFFVRTISNCNYSLETRLSSQFNRTMESAISTAMANLHKPATPTPDPEHAQEHISQLLEDGRYNEAFLLVSVLVMYEYEFIDVAV